MVFATPAILFVHIAGFVDGVLAHSLTKGVVIAYIDDRHIGHDFGCMYSAFVYCVVGKLVVQHTQQAMVSFQAG